MRDALYAGKQPLINPTVAATNKATSIVGPVTRMPAGIPIASGEWVSHCIAPVAAKTPKIPPATDNATARQRLDHTFDSGDPSAAIAKRIPLFQ